LILWGCDAIIFDVFAGVRASVLAGSAGVMLRSQRGCVEKKTVKDEKMV
jgi:hypothetical protein